MTALPCQPLGTEPELGLVEIGLWKFRYLTFGKMNDMSPFNRNAVVGSKDSSFNLAVGRKKPLPSSLRNEFRRPSVSGTVGL